MALIAHYPMNGNLDNLVDPNSPLVNVGNHTVEDGKIGKCYSKTTSYYNTGMTVIPASVSISM